MLWTLTLILLVLWALGVLAGVAGAWVHLLLGAAVVLGVAARLTGRRGG